MSHIVTMAIIATVTMFTSPAAFAAIAEIPLPAISNIAGFEFGKPCPAGFQRGEDFVCYERYVGSSKTQVVTDIKLDGSRSGCAEGYVHVGNYGSPLSGFAPLICVRYALPDQATRFLTGIYSAVNELYCHNGYSEIAMLYHRRGIELVCGEFRGRAQLPTYGVTELLKGYLGFNPYREFFAWFNAAERWVGHLGRFSRLKPDSLVIANVRILSPGLACPAGFVEVLQVGNSALPNLQQPLCARKVRADRASRALTRVYVSGSKTPELCLPGDVRAGQITTYSGTPAAPTGTANLCLRF